MGFLVANIIGGLLFLITLAVILLSNNAGGLILGGLFFAIWLTYEIVANYMILVKSKNAKMRLQNSDHRGIFNKYIDKLCDQRDSIISRKNFFESYDDGRLYELYEQIEEQMDSNINSAEAFMNTYDYVTRPNPTYLNTLCVQGDQLVVKYNKLVEQIVDVETNPTALDVAYVDDVIQCLQEIKTL